MVAQDASAECLCGARPVMFLPCSGGSNCGQIANQAAVKLAEEGVGRVYCLAGIGAHIAGMVESTRAAMRVVAIDGCEVGCARKTIEKVREIRDEIEAKVAALVRQWTQ